jgi:hypothetical protein
VSATAPARLGEAGTAVLFRCQSQLLALSTRWVERLLMGEEVREEPRPAGQALARAWIGGQAWAAWDLGLLLDVGAQDAAHVLLRLPWRDGAVRLTLRTGPCLAVQRLPPTWPLRSELFAGRRGALSAAFEAGAKGGRSGALLGYLLDPAALWTPAELDASAALLAPQPGPGAAEGA